MFYYYNLQLQWAAPHTHIHNLNRIVWLNAYQLIIIAVEGIVSPNKSNCCSVFVLILLSRRHHVDHFRSWRWPNEIWLQTFCRQSFFSFFLLLLFHIFSCFFERNFLIRIVVVCCGYSATSIVYNLKTTTSNISCRVTTSSSHKQAPLPTQHTYTQRQTDSPRRTLHTNTHTHRSTSI